MKPSTFAFLAVVSSSTLALAQPAPTPPAPVPAPPAAAPPPVAATPPAATPPAATPPAATPPAATPPAAAPAEPPAPVAPATATPSDTPKSAPDPRAVDLSMPVGAWTFRPFGFLRLGYEHVQKDSRYEFVGRNNGFVLESARLGMDVTNGSEVSARLSVDGASGDAPDINTPQGRLDVHLRDAYARYDFSKYVGAQVGQFYAPFAAEEMRSTTDLLFASRAVGQEGVRSGRGLETPGISVDRQLGVMLSPKDPIRFGDVGVSAYAMLANGNGANQLLNDDSTPAFYGRVEVYFKDWVRAGGAFLRNGRRAGTPPDLQDELDTGFAGDLLVTWNGLEVFGQFVQVSTEYQDAGGADRKQRAMSAQAGYRIETPWLYVTPAYRFAELHPWASGDEAPGGEALDSLKVDYHTVGVRLEHLRLPLSLFANYTLTMEPEPYELTNNRLQILTQASF